MSLKKLVALVGKQMPGSVVRGREIWVTAEPPVLRGYCFERSMEPRVFRPQPILIPAYSWARDLYLTYSTQLWPSDGTSTWQYDEMNIAEIVPDILAQIRGPGARFLENGRDLPAFLAYLEADSPQPKSDPYLRMDLGCGEALLGNPRAAIRWLEPLLAPKYVAYDRDWVRALSRQASDAITAIEQGNDAIHRLLDGWSQETLVNLRIVK
jgi:hypothetical protein